MALNVNPVLAINLAKNVERHASVTIVKGTYVSFESHLTRRQDDRFKMIKEGKKNH